MELKYLEQKLNDFAVKNHLVCNNINIFYLLSKLLMDNLQNIYIGSIDYDNITRKTPFENIKLIKDFYKDNNIFFDVDKYINDGTIEMRYFDEFNNKDIAKKDKITYFVSGNMGKLNHHKYINSPNNGLITDSAILVHELAHLHDEKEEDETWTRFLLTEATAFAEEFIYLNYLRDLGYVNDSNIIKKIDYDSAFNLSRKCVPLFKMIALYVELGSLSEDSYKILFDDNDYEENLKGFISATNGKMDFILQKCNYILGYTLGIYMYNEYNKDKSFMNHIQKLHTLMTEKDLIACLKEIGLNNFDYNDFDKLEEAILCVNKEIDIRKKKK